MDAEEGEFQRLYGAWASTTPLDAAALLDGFAGPWWVSGGWAIDAFTGRTRPHKDVDVTVFRRDVAALRRHAAGRFDLWAAGSGALRPLDDARPGVPRWAGQLWMREQATAPWLLDVLLNPGGPRRWVFKRDRSVSLLLDDATWVAPDGVRYLRPELVLAHKLRHARPVDDEDLRATLPLLDASSLSRLHDVLVRLDPSHRWREPVDAASQRRKSVRAGDPRHERSSMRRP
jgi:Aminoglycoside-2''-adenylyltransferase